MRRLVTTTAALAAALLLSACEPSKQDILEKAEGVDTKADLKAALGDPDDVSKLGPMETWTYEASDGSVSFVIAGDTVTLRATGEKGEKAE